MESIIIPPLASRNGTNGALAVNGNNGNHIADLPDVVKKRKPAPVFASQKMQMVCNLGKKVARSGLPVLIVGESGTGKEEIADLIHAESKRSGLYVKINCAAIPRELIESELFGHEKGAFTGASTDKDGLFQQANDGTLLLDEISEMEIYTQAKLLRILQDKTCRRVGGSKTFIVNCRIIASTNCPTDKAVREGKLRQDLFYRLSGIVINLPALRDRHDDIIPLANEFLSRFSPTINGFTNSAIELMLQYPWPGNVRELENAVQRAVLLAGFNQLIDACHLGLTSEGNSDSENMDFSDFSIADKTENLGELKRLEKYAIIAMLKETGGNKFEAAKRLGIGRQTLYNKVEAYDISWDWDNCSGPSQRSKDFSYPGPKLVESALIESGGDIAKTAELLEISLEEIEVKLKEYKIVFNPKQPVSQG